MRLEACETSTLISTVRCYMLISLTVEALFDSAIIDEQFTRDVRVFIQKIVSDQIIRLFRVVYLDDERYQLFVVIVDVF